MLSYLFSWWSSAIPVTQIKEQLKKDIETFDVEKLKKVELTQRKKPEFFSEIQLKLSKKFKNANS